MNNATIIIGFTVAFSLIFQTWWVGALYGFVCSLAACILVDGLWWLMRCVANGRGK